MTNPHIKSLLHEVMREDKEYKLCLIQDIIKGLRLSFGMGDFEGQNAVLNPAGVFDELYELSINELQIKEAALTIKLNQLMNKQLNNKLP